MKILVVEDDLSLSDILAFTLRRAGYQVATAYDGAAAMEFWANERIDLIVLDLNLPRLDGLEVCRRIRRQAATPIIILSVRGGDEAVVQGLELGADDYIVKPFSPSQLVARIRAVARRAGMAEPVSRLQGGGLELDRSRNEVKRANGSLIHLTPLEARLLAALMLNAGQVLTSETLIAAVWGSDGGDRAMLKQLVYRLRTKIDLPGAPSCIETVAGVGYSITAA